ncbi:MAG: beta-ketoacyl-ACP synthase III [Actinophytocola sp.]|nr:beta-ketoacyl-ACP synthase III [Actinophytocola sp.]
MRSSQGSAGARLFGVGGYRPEKTLTNDELATRFGKSADWVAARTGMRSRALAAKDERVPDMAAAAGSAALADADLGADDIDLVIAASCSATTPIPSVSAETAGLLGIKKAGAFDVNSACAGFCYATAVASDLVRAGSAHRVLVIGAERMSTWIDDDDLGTAIIFGDGAGAAVVGASDELGIGPVVWGSDGTASELIAIDPADRYLRMQGRQVFRWATTEIHPIALTACENAGVAPEELAAIIPHQANLRIVDAIAAKLGADNAVVAHDGEETGNTSAASIPLALARLRDTGQVASGDLALLVGFGAGLAYAAQVVRVP